MLFGIKEREAGFTKDPGVIRQSLCSQAGDEAECAVESPDNDLRAECGRLTARDCEFRNHPQSVWNKPWSQSSNQCGHVVFSEAIEKEVCREQVVWRLVLRLGF